MKLEFFITIDTDTQEFSIVNKETGESKTLPVQTKKSVKPVDDNPIPQLTLEAGKYILNNAAIKLLEIESGTRVDIKFDTNGIPIIGKSEAFGTPGTGNLLTKSNTVRYSGNNNTRLAEFGHVFEVVSMPNKPGLFKLIGNKPIPQVEEINNEVAVPEDIDLTELLDLGEDKFEVHGLDFNLN